MTPDDEDRQLEHVKEDLLREFAALPPRVVEDQVSQLVRAFTTSPVRTFVPVLVRRGARQRLREMG